MVTSTNAASRPADDGGAPSSGMAINNVVMQVFGANTDVGKTVVSAGICRAGVMAGTKVHYIKPLQTGPEGFDAAFVQRYCPPVSRSKHLYAFTITP